VMDPVLLTDVLVTSFFVLIPVTFVFAGAT
jgi:hypothetical protein